MTVQISVISLREKIDAALANTSELAVLDVREAGQYASGHLFLRRTCPTAVLKLKLVILFRLDTPIVIYDAGDGVAEKGSCGPH